MIRNVMMLQCWHLFVGSLCLMRATGEELHSEGLSSTSLLDVSSLSHLETLDSAEHGGEGYQEPDILQGLFHESHGSGFSSQETEESTILQSPQYFWEEEGKRMNVSKENTSWTHTDYPVPKSSHGTMQEGILERNLTPKETQETSTKWWSKDTRETIRGEVSSTTQAVVEEGTIQPSTQNEMAVQNLGYKEKSMFKTISTAPTSPMTKIPKKSTTHSPSWKHQPNFNVGSKQQLGPPVGSHGVPAGDSPGLNDEDDEDLLTHSSDVSQRQEETIFPKHVLTENHETTSQTVAPTDVSWGSEQVICKDWINLAGKNYVILNMSDDIDCEQFRWQKGQQLLSLLGAALSWRTESLQRDWVIALSKPNDNDNHLLMTITEEQHAIPIKDVFTALGDIKRNLAEIGIESYSSTADCQLRPNQPRSDYGKLFIVLVIIGSICVMIIIGGVVYICWQRRLPKLKSMLHFVENGCHDNPTLDVAMDGQAEMQEKKPSLNGGTSHPADGWENLINSGAKEECDPTEEDTHL
ncbi:podocalyxin-like protein 2 isoform X2 [Bombina bombina]|uniref:podocalyxin-like protein 2 isoform X2 n=1 Tax=Bombina bombina TaxID=8345 RepID=UPI00235AED8D|nr:podocalyxin-like protein 2 isoform X2 [Bombina bombina]